MSGKVSTKDLHLAGEPRVQLLPSIVKQREQTMRTRRMLVFSVVVAVALALGGTAFGFLRATQAQTALAEARDLTSQILAQQSEYAEAAQTAQLIADTESAQRTVTSNEIDWQRLVGVIAGYLPAGTTIVEIGLAAPAPWEGSIVPEGELRATGIATATITVSAADFAGAAAFVTALYGMEGIADAYITGTEINEGAYRTTISINLDDAVRSGRFDLEEGASEEESEETLDGETVVEAAP